MSFRHLIRIPLLVLFIAGLTIPAAAQPITTQTDDYQELCMVIELLGPSGQHETVTLSGSCRIEVYFEGPRVGLANDDDANQRDEVAIRMVALDVSGPSTTLGHLRLTGDTTAGPAVGVMEEVDNLVPGELDIPPFMPTGTVDCFLQASLALHLQGGSQYSEVPYEMAGQLIHEPAAPGDELHGNFVDLVDLYNVRTGWLLRVDALRLNPPPLEQLYSHVVLMLELTDPLGTEIIQLTGPGVVSALFDGGQVGQAQDDDGDGLDEVAVDLNELSLHGVSSHYGPVQLQLGSWARSSGILEESADLATGWFDLEPFAPGTAADSFFDIFVDLEIAGQLLLTHVAHEVSGPFSSLPAAPADGLIGGSPVALYDVNANATGLSLRVDYCRLNPPLEVDSFGDVHADCVLFFPTGDQESLALEGSAVIEALFEGAVMGAASDDDHDLRDDVSTWVRELELSGMSSAGAIELQLGSASPSVGFIEERVNLQNWWLDLPPFAEGQIADSFFDIFFDVDLAGVSLVTTSPSHVAGVVTHKPAGPGDELLGSDRVDLLDELGQPTGYQIELEVLQLGPRATPVDPGAPPKLSRVKLDAVPNPFNPRVRISVAVQNAGPASLRVYDPRGRLVTTLYEGVLVGGERSFLWSGLDASGRAAASGIYVLHLSHVDGVATRKITLVR